MCAFTFFFSFFFFFSENFGRCPLRAHKFFTWLKFQPGLKVNFGVQNQRDFTSKGPWKAFRREARMAFSIFEYLGSRDLKFLFKNWWPQKSSDNEDKSQNKNFSGNIGVILLKLGANYVCQARHKLSDTHFDVPMTLLSAPVPFCRKPNISIL